MTSSEKANREQRGTLGRDIRAGSGTGSPRLFGRSGRRGSSGCSPTSLRQSNGLTRAGRLFLGVCPYRALEWASARHANPRVLEAEILLGDCLNLLDRQHFDGLAKVYQALVEASEDKGLKVPRNTERGAHFLDPR